VKNWKIPGFPACPKHRIAVREIIWVDVEELEYIDFLLLFRHPFFS